MPAAKSPFPEDKQLKKPVCVLYVPHRPNLHLLTSTDIVSCGSSPGSMSLYSNAAKAVGKALAENNIPLVYGGGRRGLMGALAKSSQGDKLKCCVGVVSAAALEAGGYVHGILPKALVERASENTSAEGGEVKSQEGAGGDLLDGDQSGRMTLEVTAGMHAVSTTSAM